MNYKFILENMFYFIRGRDFLLGLIQIYPCLALRRGGLSCCGRRILQAGSQRNHQTHQMLHVPMDLYIIIYKYSVYII